MQSPIVEDVCGEKRHPPTKTGGLSLEFVFFAERLFPFASGVRNF